MLRINVNMHDGSTLVVEYDCNEESPFQALERAYRPEDRFMVYQVESITFPDR